MPQHRASRFSLVISLRVLCRCALSLRRRLPLACLSLVMALLACSGDTTESSQSPDQAQPTSTAVPPTPTPEPTLQATAEPTTAEAGAVVANAAGVDVQAAPLGTFVVARPDAGEPWKYDSDRFPILPDSVIHVYDEPNGEPRVLQDVNRIDGITLDYPLINWSSAGSPLVLRVLAGAKGDEWLLVQSPSRPHDSSMWVRSEDFDFGFTDRRIEINLAGEGELVVFEGDVRLLESPIVQGRASRETPTHQTYLVGGVAGPLTGTPAYGYAQLELASFSEVLGTFGSGGAPKNYLHGTNVPELMGQRVSSGEIRIRDDELEALIDLVGPGTPVTLFDSSIGETPEALQDRSLSGRPAVTAALDVTLADVSPAVERVLPQLWETCSELYCVRPFDEASLAVTPFEFAVAAPRPDGDQIPVYDEPGGPMRTLVDANEIDGVHSVNPLFETTTFEQPLVLRVLDNRVDQGWLKVQVPTRPNHSHVWVRAQDFEIQTTTVRVEATTASTPESEAGMLWVYRDGVQIFEAPVASGRESRPTPLGTGWVGQLIEGPPLSPAYGPWVIDFGTFSEDLGSFGGGGTPLMVVHGTNQPEGIGTRVTSGEVRLLNDDLDAFAAIDGIVGAPVHIHDRPQMGLASITAFNFTQPALTTIWSPDAPPLPVTPL